jgi:hypothetical protein
MRSEVGMVMEETIGCAVPAKTANKLLGDEPVKKWEL